MFYLCSGFAVVVFDHILSLFLSKPMHYLQAIVIHFCRNALNNFTGLVLKPQAIRSYDPPDLNRVNGL